MMCCFRFSPGKPFALALPMWGMSAGSAHGAAACGILAQWLSWPQLAECFLRKTSIGHKAAITAGKVLCAAAIDHLLEQPELIAAAKTEFAGRTAEGYTCPIPPEAVPTIPD